MGHFHRHGFPQSVRLQLGSMDPCQKRGFCLVNRESKGVSFRKRGSLVYLGIRQGQCDSHVDWA
jgi:hypothetical protein